jgi:D-alanine-D-alanine ligase
MTLLSLACRHFARVDFRLSNNGTPYALELNAIPGFTARSDLPKAAAKTGISMSELCRKIVEAALENENSRETLVNPAKR